MEKVFSILPNGNISVLGVHIGMDILSVERTLQRYKAHRNHSNGVTGVIVNGVWLGGYRLNMHMIIDDGAVRNIHLFVDARLHGKNTATLIEEFESLILESFEKLDNNGPKYYNALLNIIVHNTENLSKHGFHITISPRIWYGKKIELSNTEITELYNVKKAMTPHRKITLELTDKSYKIAIVVFSVFALIIAYLFALNGRYEKWDEQLLLDKWTQEYWWNYEKPLFKHSLPDD